MSTDTPVARLSTNPIGVVSKRKVDTGNGSTKTFSGTLIPAPQSDDIVTFTYEVSSITKTATFDLGKGKFGGDCAPGTTVDATTGTFTLVTRQPPDNQARVTAEYSLPRGELSDGLGMQAVQFGVPHSVDGLDSLLTLPGVSSLKDRLPEKLSSFPNLHLEDLLYSSGSLIVGLRWPDARWSPCSLFALSDPGLMVAVPASPMLMVQVDGTIEFATLPFHCTVTLQKGGGSAFDAELSPAPQALRPALTALHLDGSSLDERNLTALSFHGSADSLTFHGAVAGPWHPVPGLPEFTLDALDLTLERQREPPGVCGTFSAKGEVADLTFAVYAAHSGPGLGWQLMGRLHAPPGDLTLAALAVKLHWGEPPSVIGEIDLEDVSLSMDTATGTLTMHCELGLPGGATLTADLAQTSTELHVAGQLMVGELEFDLIFDKQAATDKVAATKSFMACYHNSGGGKITLGDIVKGLSDTGADGLDEISVKLKDALVVYQPKASGTASRYLLALHMDTGLDLSAMKGLPLIGKVLPTDQTLRLAFTPIIASQPPPEMGDLRNQIPAGSLQIPETITRAFTCLTHLYIGDESRSLTFGSGSSGSSGSSNPDAYPTKNEDLKDSKLGSPEPPPADATPLNPGAGLAAVKPQDVTWIDIQKHLGPISFERLGLGYSKGSIHALIDAALALGPVTIGLEGLGASYNLSSHELGFELRGLSVAVENPPMSVSGSFMKVGDQFAGQVTLHLETLSLGAIGAYSKDDTGHPSLFIYAFLDYPLGGPAFFFVEGLAVGFGYNRRLIVPPINQISSFPLVSEVMPHSPKTTSPPSSPEDPGQTVGDKIAEMVAYIPPQTDQYFLAVGIKFNSFKLLDGFALLVVSFGRHLEFDLLGVMSMKLPPNSKTVLADVELEFSARVRPDEGFIGVQAQLTPQSYILSRKCHLQGGFAFYSWVKGDHGGDFVFTMGGYHPHFKVPGHYPQNVPRLGFNWQVDSHLTLKGTAYYALTSGAVMAGGSLSATFNSGPLAAWFRLALDLLMQWKPYHYEAELQVSIGARLSIHVPLIGSVGVTIDAGADLRIWGPEFGGHAHVHVKVMGIGASFSVDFGQSVTAPPALPWEDFCKDFLPVDKSEKLDENKICSITATSGLLRVMDEPAGKRFVVNPKELVLVVSSLVPMDGDFGIAPMHVEQATSHTTITFQTSDEALTFQTSDEALRCVITSIPNGFKVTQQPVGFAFTTLQPKKLKLYPGAMWGKTHDPSAAMNAPPIRAPGTIGFCPATPSERGQTKSIQRDELDYDVFPRQLPPADGEQLTYTCIDPGELSSQLKDSSASRDGVLKALGIDPRTAVRLSEDLATTFVEVPLVVRSTAA